MRKLRKISKERKKKLSEHRERARVYLKDLGKQRLNNIKNL